jgi:PAS domain S-box/diguanylate cyclase (GGDEF) domain
MLKNPRSRFIVLAILGYVILSLAWIFLSDRLLSLFASRDALVWFSTLKGVFFVITSATVFFFVLRAVPPEAPPTQQSRFFLSTLFDGVAHGKQSQLLIYGFTLLISFLMLGLRAELPVMVAERPMMIFFMFPIILSALIGGLLPGLLATILLVAGVDMASIPHLHELSHVPYVQLQWAFLAINGIAVSVLSYLLHSAIVKQISDRHLLSAVVSGTSDAIFVKDLNSRYILANTAAAEFVGRPHDQLIGYDDYALFSEASAQELIAKDQAIIAAKQVQTKIENLTTQNGQAFTFLITKGPVFDTNGNIAGLFGIARNITEQKQLIQQIKISEERFQLVVEAISDGFWDWDICAGTVYRSPRYLEMIGYSPDEDTHDFAFFEKLIHPEDRAYVLQNIEDHKQGKILSLEFSFRLITHSGMLKWARISGRALLRDPQGNALRIIGSIADITEHQEHEAELDRVAHYDPLTGLPNRRLLSDRLNQAIIRSARKNSSCAVCLFDLDGFKNINDRFGHLVGDQLLIAITQNLKGVLRADDTLARLGGDEFVVLLSEITSAEDCTLILDRMLKVINQESQCGDYMLQISASIGVSLYPEDNVDPDTLLRHADQAMYLAKESGKNCYQLFDPVRDQKAQQHRNLMEQLHHGLLHGEFTLFYQPKVDLTDGRIIGAEALIRWNHPERGLMSPAEFLPFIHGSELEITFGEWVIDRALAQTAMWSTQGITTRVSVNVSANHLLKPGFSQYLQTALHKYPSVLPVNFELEILESAAIADMEQAIAILHDCRKLGVHFSLDDFGTGYSSLTYLRRLPVDTLKIDQSFVRDMLEDNDDLGIVEGVIQLASVFNRHVIAEGVETLEQGKKLGQLGCNHVQGYGIAKPMPADLFPQWCAEWKDSKLWLATQPD